MSLAFHDKDGPPPILLTRQGSAKKIALLDRLRGFTNDKRIWSQRHKEHTLQRVHTEMGRSICDACDEEIVVTPETGSHYTCPEEKCDFDICLACQSKDDYLALPKQLMLKHHRHVLSRSKPKSNWVCDVCDAVPPSASSVSYECKMCDFDCCEKCAQPTRERALLDELHDDQKLSAAAQKIQRRFRKFRKERGSCIQPVTDVYQTKLDSFRSQECTRDSSIISMLLEGDRNGGAFHEFEICFLVLEYAEEYTIRVDSIPVSPPLRFTLQGASHPDGIYIEAETSADGTFVYERRLTIAQTYREFAALLGCPDSCIRIFANEVAILDGKIDAKSALPSDSEALFYYGKRRMLKKGRPCMVDASSCGGRDIQVKPSVVVEQRSVQANAAWVSRQAQNNLWGDMELLREFATESYTLEDLSRDVHEQLSEEQRMSLSSLFVRDALAEHASVASFSKFSLQLMHLGAPPALLLAAQRAATDEVRHTQLCFAIADALCMGNEDMISSVGAFPVVPVAAVDYDVAQTLLDTFREGCIGETVSCVQLAIAADRCVNPLIKKVLDSVVADEARHALFNWQVFQWGVGKFTDKLEDDFWSRVSDIFANASRAAGEGVANSLSERKRESDFDVEEWGRLTPHSEFRCELAVVVRCIEQWAGLRTGQTQFAVPAPPSRDAVLKKAIASSTAIAVLDNLHRALFF